ncbi:hypothetical protein KUTeg_023311 [Tegillarca granosa]|uniref:Uncharacterized protein n=1 Tax=Tegillarca granosa TaxID=220873 RepID=A0ABQ9E4A4_TEGGR|nr:hypothetical protein KUTeg_023311 [Tegillarca granosa]
MDNIMDNRHKIDSKKKVVSTIFLTVAALIFVCIASFADLWWETYTYVQDSTSKNRRVTFKYGLWENVNCVDGVCTRQGVDSTGWIIFTRLMGITGLILCSMSLVSQIAYLFSEKPALKYIGALLFLTALVVTGEFHKLSTSLTGQSLRYGTLPLGLLFFSSFMSTIAAIFLVVNLSRPAKTV